MMASTPRFAGDFGYALSDVLVLVVDAMVGAGFARGGCLLVRRNRGDDGRAARLGELDGVLAH